MREQRTALVKLHAPCALLAAIWASLINAFVSEALWLELHSQQHCLDTIVVDVGNTHPEGTHHLSASDVNELSLQEGSCILVTKILNGGVNLLNMDTLKHTNIVPRSVGWSLLHIQTLGCLQFDAIHWESI